MFLTNSWYVASLSQEIQDKPLGRTICNQNIVFFRNKEGRVVALEDFCPHRGAPLSLGFVRGGELVCGYHGLAVNGAGRCASMPGQRVDRFPGVRSYPVVERDDFVWVWPGDPALADPATVLELPWSNKPGWVFAGGMSRMACDYRLVIDNLMDLTHEVYVHAGSFGQPEIEQFMPQATIDGDEVTVSRRMTNIIPPPFWANALKGNGVAHDVPCDRWQISHYTPPANVLLQVGCAHVGTGAEHAAPDRRASGIVVNFLTPETETSTWYAFGLARTFGVTDSSLTKSFLEAQHKAFGEDLQMLEQQQANHLRRPNRKLLTLNIDSGGEHARRVLKRLIAEEQQRSAHSDAQQASSAAKG